MQTEPSCEQLSKIFSLPGPSVLAIIQRAQCFCGLSAYSKILNIYQINIQFTVRHLYCLLYISHMYI